MNLSKLSRGSMSQRQLNKPSFRKVFKDRGMHSKSQIQQESQPLSRPVSKKSLDQQKSRNTLLQAIQNKKISELNNSVNGILHKLNFKHHCQDNCLCSGCNCGRHFCNLRTVKPSLNLKIKSSYSLHYDNKMQAKSIKKSVVLSKEVSPLIGPTLINKSNYKNDFRTLQVNRIQKNRPQDNLKFQGPSQNLTSYAQQFHKFGGTNQYIKPTDRHTISHFPFSHRTSYSDDFKARNIQRTKSLKNKDVIKLGKLWLGQSVYSENYVKSDNPEQTKLPNPLIQKPGSILKSLDTSRRFVTNYKKQFIQKQQVHCPSKIQISRSVQKMKLRHLLIQNGDFKGMNPQFKAIATSKHFYV